MKFPAAHLERPGMRLGEERVGVAGVDSDDQAALAAGRDRHVAGDEEGETSEHPLLGHVGVPRDQSADAVGEILVIGHPGGIIADAMHRPADGLAL